MFVDALIHKAMNSSIKDICLRMVVTMCLLDLIKKDLVEGLKNENWKAEHIKV